MNSQRISFSLAVAFVVFIAIIIFGCEYHNVILSLNSILYLVFSSAVMYMEFALRLAWLFNKQNIYNPELISHYTMCFIHALSERLIMFILFPMVLIMTLEYYEYNFIVNIITLFPQIMLLVPMYFAWSTNSNVFQKIDLHEEWKIERTTN